jgi:hypothetical protein
MPGREPGLADAGFAADQPDPAAPVSRRAQRRVMEFAQLRNASDERILAQARPPSPFRVPIRERQC